MYKDAIRQAYIDYENEFDDELYNNFINKNKSEFWKSWHSKFQRTLRSTKIQQINGLFDDRQIADEFADAFWKG